MLSYCKFLSFPLLAAKLFYAMILILAVAPPASVIRADIITVRAGDEGKSIAVGAELSHRYREAGQEVTAQIRVSIPEGWYVYADVDEGDMAAGLAGDPEELHVEVVAVEWPEAQKRTDLFLGALYFILPLPGLQLVELMQAAHRHFSQDG